MTDDSYTEHILALRPWLFKVAWQYSNDYNIVQDLVQEANVEIWREIQAYKPTCGVPLEVHLKNKAKWRMKEILQRGNYTGMESRQGRKHVAGTESNKNREVSVDRMLSYFDVAKDCEDLELSYHHGEIIEAINSLPPHQRKLVYERFWLGLWNPQNGSWWYSKRIGARDRLAKQLAQLAPDFGGRLPAPEVRVYRSYQRQT